MGIAIRTERPEAVDAAIPVNLPTDDVLRTISSFGCAGAPGAALEAHCELLGSSAVVTWQPPEESSALPVVAYVVQRAVGETGQYEPVGHVHAARFEQCVEDVGGQALRYRVQEKDRGGNVGAWARSCHPLGSSCVSSRCSTGMACSTTQGLLAADACTRIRTLQAP